MAKLFENSSLRGEDHPLLPDGLHVEASSTSHSLGYLLLEYNLDLLQNSVMPFINGKDLEPLIMSRLEWLVVNLYFNFTR